MSNIIKTYDLKIIVICNFQIALIHFIRVFVKKKG